MEEAPVTLEEALQADEVFTSGTAVVVSPVGSLTHKGKKIQYGEPGVPGTVLTQLHALHRLCDAQGQANTYSKPGVPGVIRNHTHALHLLKF